MKSNAQRGFGMIEVLVSLIIIAVGMLGLAKLQALVYSSTGTSAMRSIAAIQASSLAAMMHTNRNYWGSVANGFSYSFSGASGTPSSTDSTVVGTPPTCTTSSPCSASGIATIDLANWRTGVIGALPGPTGTVSCTNVSPNPVTCTVQMTWIEGSISANTNSQGNTTSNVSAPFVLWVVP